METKNTEENKMLDAYKILHSNGYTCKSMGLSFKIISPLGTSTIETLTGLIELSRKLTQTIL